LRAGVYLHFSTGTISASTAGIELSGRPEFDEYTVILAGMLRVENQSGVIDVMAGQAILTHAGEWVRYSTPGPDGEEYIAVCLPALSPARRASGSCPDLDECCRFPPFPENLFLCIDVIF
jgi:mannose-6-phosphate isomerase-like protein (cupin superfamily)